VADGLIVGTGIDIVKLELQFHIATLARNALGTLDFPEKVEL
jgi:hypothetical protein